MNLTMPEISLPPRLDTMTVAHPVEGQTLSEVPLRVKGFLAFAAVVIYAVLLTTFTYNKITKKPSWSTNSSICRTCTKSKTA